MSECPPPGVAEDAAEHRSQALTPAAIERVLADFRVWLEDLARKGESPPPPVSDDELEPIDLHTLLGQMAALRHEVHLQTRAVRAQQEQNTTTLDQLGAALEAVRERPSEAASDQTELLRPLLKSLVELYDALALAAREVQRVQEMALASLPRTPSSAPADRVELLLDLAREWEATSARAQEQAYVRPRGWLARWFGAGNSERDALAAERDALAAEGKVVAALREALTLQTRQSLAARQEGLGEAERVHRLLESVITGYTMSLQRVERALRQHDLEPIECLGLPFDPERMEVLEVATDTGRPSGEVVEEVRRGYHWRGRVFRFAQVRVARS